MREYLALILAFLLGVTAAAYVLPRSAQVWREGQTIIFQTGLTGAHVYTLDACPLPFSAR